MKEGAQSKMEVKYIDVKQFAAEVGQSFQSIYKHIKNGKLDNYLSKVNGKIYIDRDALELFNPNSQESENGSRETNFRKGERKGELFEDLQIQLANEREANISTTHQLSILKIENENLARQREHYTQEIERLQKELDEVRANIKHKDELIENMTARLSKLIENEQELFRNSQVLQAQAQQKRGFFARLFAPKEKSETV